MRIAKAMSVRRPVIALAMVLCLAGISLAASTEASSRFRPDGSGARRKGTRLSGGLQQSCSKPTGPCAVGATIPLHARGVTVGAHQCCGHRCGFDAHLCRTQRGHSHVLGAQRARPVRKRLDSERSMPRACRRSGHSSRCGRRGQSHIRAAVQQRNALLGKFG